MHNMTGLLRQEVVMFCSVLGCRVLLCCQTQLAHYSLVLLKNTLLFVPLPLYSANKTSIAWAVQFCKCIICTLPTQRKVAVGISVCNIQDYSPPPTTKYTFHEVLFLRHGNGKSFMQFSDEMLAKHSVFNSLIWLVSFHCVFKRAVWLCHHKPY